MERHVDVYTIDHNARRINFAWTLPWDLLLAIDHDEFVGLYLSDPHEQGDCHQHVPILGGDWQITGPAAAVA